MNNIIELELDGGDTGHVKYAAVGGLSDQIRQLRESIELPLTNPELFLRVGIGMKLPKVWYETFCMNDLRFMFDKGKCSQTGCSSLWTSWNWQDIISKSNFLQRRC